MENGYPNVVVVHNGAPTGHADRIILYNSVVCIIKAVNAQQQVQEVRKTNSRDTLQGKKAATS